jgi:hypothetical protein
MSEKTQNNLPQTPEEVSEWIDEAMRCMTELHLSLDNKKMAKALNLMGENDINRRTETAVSH